MARLERLHVPSRAELDELVREAPAFGWTLLFPDRQPYAGGPGHCAAIRGKWACPASR
ncbi:hypothetical protein [Streptomyces sp. NPDC058202]|uniref:hypothetical protein n=1 Tax=Streptomyces sp. NPDC058202 TaxID=3346380 RepID=UPI0036EDF8E7